MVSDLPTITADTPIDELAERMIRERRPMFLIVERNRTGHNGDIIGTVSPDALARTRDPSTVSISDVVTRDAQSVSADAAVIDVLMQLWSDRADQLLIEQDGQVIDAVIGSDIIDVANLRERAGIV
ncbi:CBS domain-containing protein [Natronorubrum halophilum]|uniref:CBS domain-containing protein n=1 Tax=Natronorubrum halophilum TaxID=1702106 RepID=UPI0010C1A384|nr:CBS domain-containing protein [Natronorubrum halophilum]